MPIWPCGYSSNHLYLRASSVGRPVLPATVIAGISGPGFGPTASLPVPLWSGSHQKYSRSRHFFRIWREALSSRYCTGRGHHGTRSGGEPCKGKYFSAEEGCRGRLPGAGLDPPPASSALPFTGLPAKGAAGSECRERAEDALTWGNFFPPWPGILAGCPREEEGQRGQSQNLSPGSITTSNVPWLGLLPFQTIGPLAPSPSLLPFFVLFMESSSLAGSSLPQRIKQAQKSCCTRCIRWWFNLAPGGMIIIIMIHHHHRQHWTVRLNSSSLSCTTVSGYFLFVSKSWLWAKGKVVAEVLTRNGAWEPF